MVTYAAERCTLIVALYRCDYCLNEKKRNRTVKFY